MSDHEHRRNHHELDRATFLRQYVDAMHQGDAALFVGAGLSRTAGFVDWKELMRRCASELGLDIDQEHDLVAVAQYYLNRTQNRGLLNQILKDEFDRPATFTENHRIIGRLPVGTVWTTNFDSLLEDAYEAADRVVDVKSRDGDMSLTKKGRDVVLFKMHGDIARPDEIIICKQDYERYAKRHWAFQNALQGDLVNKTFLFLGFSFHDPNIDYMLGHLRSLLEDSRRAHYAIMRRVRKDWRKQPEAEAERLFQYERTRQSLRMQDLQRYGIQTVLVDQYAEVTQILNDLERGYFSRSVFVSGSANEFGDFGEDRMRDLCMHLGERLMDDGYKLVCGMGLNVGDAVTKGALVRVFESRMSAVEKHLFLRPFPRNLPPDVDEQEFNKRYREELIAQSASAIFIAGTSRTSPESRGVLEEFAIAKRLRRIPIPIGATGFAARRIWEEIATDLPAHYGGAVDPELFGRLNDATLSNDELVDAVIAIVQRVSTIWRSTNGGPAAAGGVGRGSV